MLAKAKNNQKKFELYEQRAMDRFAELNNVVVKIQSDNEELAAIHADIEAEIEKLKMLKIDVANRIASNQNVLSNLENIIQNE